MCQRINPFLKKIFLNVKENDQLLHLSILKLVQFKYRFFLMLYRKYMVSSIHFSGFKYTCSMHILLGSGLPGVYTFSLVWSIYILLVSWYTWSIRILPDFKYTWSIQILLISGIPGVYIFSLISSIPGVYTLSLISGIPEMEFKEFKPRFKSAKIRQNPV